MKKTLIALSLSAFLAGCAANRNSGAAGAGSETFSGSASGTPAEEANFARQACHTGVAEAEIGKLAARNTRNQEVRKLANRLVKDHTQAEKELSTIFARKGISAEPELATEFKNSISHLSTLSGPAFDRAFKQQVISDHQQAIALFEQQAADGTDPDLRKFAERRLPQLRSHLATAEQLNVGAEVDADARKPETDPLPHALKGPVLQPNAIQR